MTSPTVDLTVDNAVATLTLNSPANRNALSFRLMDELAAALAAAVADPAVRVIVLSHAGPVFCAGADLRETSAAVAAGTPLPVMRVAELLADFWECPKPVIARVGGPARAGGLGLLATADLVVAAESATFAFTEVRLGVVPAAISPVVLPRLTPRGAAELYLTAEPVTAARAADFGLVTAVVGGDGLDAAVAAYATALVKGAPGALEATKRLCRDGAGAVLGEGPAPSAMRARLVAAAAVSARTFAGAEGREGLAAFADKRPPTWGVTPDR
ncbi:enoyl-CoA hydratase-related protein [Luedemannella helvata]|uniref:Enoyl-CoA hydratase family protein n=1 Tax=Luedemannella helvata TaxID=349315 RepID=A0ABN2KJC4_9ACTN